MPNCIISIYLNDEDYMKYIPYKTEIYTIVKNKFKEEIAKLKWGNLIMDKTMNNEKQSSIGISKTSTGKYSWDLKLYFNESDENPSDIIARLKMIDNEMKTNFNGDGL